MSDSLDLKAELQRSIDDKTKPLGALGRLEDLALQLGLIQGTRSPRVEDACIYVFAADHGIAREGVSAYPQTVTRQMVQNFLAGGAAISVFAKLNGMQLRIVDAGVIEPCPAHALLVARRIGPGTRNFLHEPAMSAAQCDAALRAGAELMAEARAAGTRVVGLGDMGIGNTSSASVLTSLTLGAPLERCVGRGAGLDDIGVRRKLDTLRRAVAARGTPPGARERLQLFGGFEIAMLAGALAEAARQRTVILVDGFIVCAALAIACELEPRLLECCVFCHRSAEPGHDLLLERFGAKPLLDLSMRLGEGSGAALAYPLVRAAAAFLNDMATFESAAVSRKSPP
ncbi:MAG: nicotinate-nucleotide--dimethylbenzimidazole phosphoribosyltransferase [Betaproteobacteria bacterium]|jgi:nicotinate-nucleotide--dimethylbenzimidazole phosphoribosyltransferase|nr:nicotinate-nucleotide--dimethylbenzimidazole phosphoribosyltransferase [Betaproteobacteria bacterium]